MAIAIAMFMITMGLVGGGHVRFTFFPPVEGDNVAAAVTMPLGTTMEETKRAVEKLNRLPSRCVTNSMPKAKNIIRVSSATCSDR